MEVQRRHLGIAQQVRIIDSIFSTSLITRLDRITDDPAQVIPHSDLVLLAAPSNSHQSILKNIAPHLKSGSVIGSVFCQGEHNSVDSIRTFQVVSTGPARRRWDSILVKSEDFGDFSTFHGSGVHSSTHI